MVSDRDRSIILNVIEGVLGSPKKFRNDEYAYHCPFCNHHKKKLQVNINSQNWHCWVCNASGKKVHTLLKRVSVDERTIRKIKEVYEESSLYSKDTEKQEEKQLFLPREYKPLWKPSRGFDPIYKQSLYYLKTRGISTLDILKYMIGYVDEGEYSNRVIIPSYDKNNKLNYFIARSVYPKHPIKYKNPPASKDIIMFENQINWDEPITLVEGVFDAISVKKNSIPLLGKFIPDILMKTIFENDVKRINILLDDDAQRQALYYTDYFQKQDIEVSNIVLEDKDPSDSGFEKVNKLVRESKTTDYKEIINQKLKF